MMCVQSKAACVCGGGGLVKERDKEKERSAYAQECLKAVIVDGTIFTFLSLRRSVNELVLIYHPLITV